MIDLAPAITYSVSIPVPGCMCPPGYVRDVCHGHPSPACPFKGLFGEDLVRAHWHAQHPYGEQLAIPTQEEVADAA